MCEDKNSNIVEVDSVSAVTPHNEALYEAGKAMLVESVEVGREFCKFMIGVSTGAIPIYLGLLKFLLPSEYVPSVSEGIVYAVPAGVFLVAAIVFVMGFFPHRGKMSLDHVDEIEQARSESVERRYKRAMLGFELFACGIVFAVAAAIWAITNDATATVDAAQVVGEVP